jgi:hypothetical protein
VTGPGGGEIDISGDDQGGGFNTCERGALVHIADGGAAAGVAYRLCR